MCRLLATETLEVSECRCNLVVAWAGQTLELEREAQDGVALCTFESECCNSRRKELFDVLLPNGLSAQVVETSLEVGRKAADSPGGVVCLCANLNDGLGTAGPFLGINP